MWKNEKNMSQQLQVDINSKKDPGSGEQQALLNILEDMQMEKDELQDQRIATFNIMDDVAEVQDKLERKYVELDVLKGLTQSLGISLELDTVIGHIVKAIRKIFPDLTVAYVYTPLEANISSKSIHISTEKDLGEKYLDLVNKQVVDGMKDVPNVDIWELGKNFSFDFIEGGKDLNSDILPESYINMPMIVPDTVAGLFSISSITPNVFDKNKEDVIRTIIDSAVQTITQLKVLIASEHSRLHDLLESMSNAVLMFGIDRQVIVANPEMKRIVGLKEGKINLDDVLDFFNHNKDSKEEKAGKLFNLSEEVDKSISSIETVHIPEFFLKKNTYEIHITPVRDSNGKSAGGAIIFHDITHLKDIDRMKTEFVSVASHQLRTPLTAIKLLVERLSKGRLGKLNKEQKEYIDDVEESTERMIRLVNDLLNVSRLETGRMKIDSVLTNFEDFVEDIINEALPLCILKDCKITFKKLEKEIGEIMIDQTLFRQVIHNLITNAIRYSNDKGKIEVKVESGDKEYIISVKDDGIGIPMDVQPRIFEKFFRADNAQKAETEGSGLGLYVVKMVVEAYGGRIWFDSQEGKGTTFYVTILNDGMKMKEGEKGFAD